MLEYAPLKAVYIFFDTATYDEIERDEKVLFSSPHIFVIYSVFIMNAMCIYLKVTMEAQLGLIGGTMGLLTGFSILSGVEIIYYLLRIRLFSVQLLLFNFLYFCFFRFFMSLKTPTTEIWKSFDKEELDWKRETIMYFM